MPSGKLTKRSIDAFQPSLTATETVLWDQDLPGFGLRVTRNGVKSFVLQYRNGRGRRAPSRKLTIGKYGRWTLDQARGEARRLFALVNAGHDPAADRTAALHAPTVAQAIARFEIEHFPRCKPATVRMYKLALPVIGSLFAHRTIASLTMADVAALVAAHSAHPTWCNWLRGCLSVLFNYSEKWGYRPTGSNPTKHVPGFKLPKREVVLNREEWGRLGRALVTEDIPPAARTLIMLLLYTGARKSEIRQLRWDQIDTARAVARLSDSKTGAKNLIFGQAALAMLAALPRISLFVFPSPLSSSRPLLGYELDRSWIQVRKAAQLDRLHLHDLRHQFASVAAANGESLQVVGRLLGHSSPAMTARYSHLTHEPALAAADRVAPLLQDLLAGASK